MGKLKPRKEKGLTRDRVGRGVWGSPHPCFPVSDSDATRTSTVPLRTLPWAWVCGCIMSHFPRRFHYQPISQMGTPALGEKSLAQITGLGGPHSSGLPYSGQ